MLDFAYDIELGSSWWSQRLVPLNPRSPFFARSFRYERLVPAHEIFKLELTLLEIF